MLTHYFRFLTRKQPLFAILNLAGLATGMCAALLLYRYVQYEYSYDRQSPYADNIWRVFNRTVAGENAMTLDANTHSAVGPVLKAEVPGVLDFTRLYCGNSPEVVVLAGNQPFEVVRCYMADQGFLRMFPQIAMEGDTATCLNEPHTCALTHTQARRFFGAAPALGQSIRVTQGMMAGLYRVSAILADPPENTHLKFDILLSYATRYTNGHEDNFESYWDYNYFRLAPGTPPDGVRAKLADINRNLLSAEGIALDIQRFADIHLHSNLTYELEPNSSARSVRFLGLIALFVLGIACINYINLSTAFAGERAREVGVRKAVGAGRGALAIQFLLESLALNVLAFALALLGYFQLLPWFGTIVGQPLHTMPGDASFWLTAAAIPIGMALLAALYPALHLAGFNPIAALKGGNTHWKAAHLRKTMVVLQFACSAGLILGILTVNRQLLFLRQHEKGVQLDQVLAIKAVKRNDNRDTLATHNIALLQAAFRQIPGIEGMAYSSVAPGLGINGISGSNRPLHWTQRPDYTHITSYFVNTDEHFFTLLGVKVLAGQHRLQSNPDAQYNHVSINRTMMEALGFPSPEAAIGQQIAYENSENGATSTIMAVVEDFHIESLKTRPKPTLYYCFPPERLQYLSVKIAAENASAALAAMQQEWTRVYPEAPFTWCFLDEQFDRQYRSESRFEQAFGLFAALAVFISCLGLFGLTAYDVQRRRKEIGVRKVLGAGTAGIARMLTLRLVKLVAISFAVGLPVTWYAMQHWLQDFAYRIDIQWWMLLLTMSITLLVATLTVGLQSLRAALANPVKSLHHE